MSQTPRRATPKRAASAAPAQPVAADAPSTGAPASWTASEHGPGAPLTAKQDRERATLAHFSVALGFAAPLAVWLLYRDRGPFTAQEAKEALNFSVPPTLLMVLFFFLSLLPVMGPLFAVLAALTWAAMAVYGLLGGSQVNRGRPFRYPFNLRILR